MYRFHAPGQIYYDRAMKNVDDRKGQWFVYRELEKENGSTTTG